MQIGHTTKFPGSESLVHVRRYHGYKVVAWGREVITPECFYDAK